MRTRKTEKLYVRVTPEQAQWISKMSAAAGLTKNDFVGLIIEKAMTNDGGLLVIVGRDKPNNSISS